MRDTYDTAAEAAAHRTLRIECKLSGTERGGLSTARSAHHSQTRCNSAAHDPGRVGSTGLAAWPRG
jgi:hypothetical protein